MKLLVVHRELKTIRQSLSQLHGQDLAIKGHESGLDGLFTSRLEKFDLIICGTDLPVVTGYELVRAMRTYSVNRTTPVIFLADEIDATAEKLGSVLGVVGLLGLRDTPTQLPTMVEEQFVHWQRANQEPSH